MTLPPAGSMVPGAGVRRAGIVERLADRCFDVAVVGGGINGASAAAALAAAGATVALLEQGDFASGTSQESSNLAWGGIKYLENRELGLVRGLCRSRNRLMAAYPLAVPEMRFLLTHPANFRHGLGALQAGAWLYWILGQRYTRPPSRWSADRLSSEAPIINSTACNGALSYSDAWLRDGDARFTFNLIKRAEFAGAVAANYTRCIGAEFMADRWNLTVQDQVSGTQLSLRARVLINACGPWADAFTAQNDLHTAHRHLFSKGIHLVVPKLPAAERVLAFFADDGRLFFAIPMGNRTCIGTTDTPVDGPDCHVTDSDRDFVLNNINARLNLTRPLGRNDIIAERCGVRPLVAPMTGGNSGDWLQLSRKHVLESNLQERRLTVFGGKLTDCLNVGEEIVAAAAEFGLALRCPGVWYGEGPDVDRQQHRRAVAAAGFAHALPSGVQMADYLWRRHGALASELLLQMQAKPELAEPLLAEFDTLQIDAWAAVRHELVVYPEDFLRRRTLLALCHRPEALSGCVKALSALAACRT